MIQPIDDGGPAFPLQEHGDSRSVPGMSLRDYFAIHATEEDVRAFTPDTVGKCAIKLGVSYQDWNQSHSQKIRTMARYEFADAMLKTREGK